jgi:hypothetical protein
MRRARLEAERRDDHIADLVCARVCGNSQGLARCESPLERRVGGRRVHRRVVRDRQIPDRDLLAHAGKASVYGAAGSLALILLWTYYSALIFLLGVEFTQVWVRSRGRETLPKAGAIALEPSGA